MGVQESQPQVGGQRAKTPEAESSVAFETPAEKPNFTLATVFTEISRAKSVVGRG